VNVKEYGRAVVLGGRSLLDAAASWRENPLTDEVNRRLWGPLPLAALAVLTAAGIAAAAVLPPSGSLIGLVPPLAALAYIPSSVRDVLYSAPAFFAFVVAWRVRRLRKTSGHAWLASFGADEPGARFFQAGALPAAVASVVLVVGIEVVAIVVPEEAAVEVVELVEVPEAEPSRSGAVSHARDMAHNLVIVALAAALLGVHREVGKGLGQLLGAAFSVWCTHLVIGFTVPWLVGSWSYLPVVGELASRRSPHLVHLLFDLSVVMGAWAAAYERTRRSPLWEDVQPPPEDEDAPPEPAG